MPIVKDKTTIKEGFRSCSNKGFHMKFPNGWTVSVQFGKGNYCENYNLDIDGDYTHFVLNPPDMESRDAEVLCWNADGKKQYPENPLENQSVMDVLKLMNMIAKKRK